MMLEIRDVTGKHILASKDLDGTRWIMADNKFVSASYIEVPIHMSGTANKVGSLNNVNKLMLDLDTYIFNAGGTVMFPPGRLTIDVGALDATQES
jgi:hypothetical protein